VSHPAAAPRGDDSFVNWNYFYMRGEKRKTYPRTDRIRLWFTGKTRQLTVVCVPGPTPHNVYAIWLLRNAIIVLSLYNVYGVWLLQNAISLA